MVSLVSIIIMGMYIYIYIRVRASEVGSLTKSYIDLVPAREVAIYRSYENVINVIGRSMGAPLGGLLSDTIGWRWYACPQSIIGRIGRGISTNNIQGLFLFKPRLYSSPPLSRFTAYRLP